VKISRLTQGNRIADARGSRSPRASIAIFTHDDRVAHVKATRPSRESLAIRSRGPRDPSVRGSHHSLEGNRRPLGLLRLPCKRPSRSPQATARSPCAAGRLPSPRFAILCRDPRVAHALDTRSPPLTRAMHSRGQPRALARPCRCPFVSIVILACDPPSPGDRPCESVHPDREAPRVSSAMLSREQRDHHPGVTPCLRVSHTLPFRERRDLPSATTARSPHCRFSLR
jgi:hypothetical protein